MQGCQLNCYKKDLILKQVQIAHDSALASCRLCKSLISAGRKPSSSSGCSVVNLGISNLTATAKTDLANRFLLLRDEFIEVWEDLLVKNTNPNAITDTIEILLPEGSVKNII